MTQGLATQRGLRLSQDDILRREVIMRLMCDFALDPQAISKRFNISFENYFADALKILEPMAADGLFHWNACRLIVSPTGRLLIRNLCMAFDAYLKENPNQKFSRTI